MNTAQREPSFQLEEYLTESIRGIVKSMTHLSSFSAKESLFMTSFAQAAHRAASVRRRMEEAGEHIPPFLIASITHRCNLHCVGCYARSVGSCADGADDPMTADEWERVFSEAKDLGITFILLAGGEPLVRKDVLERAAKYPEILFPVITNGTMIGEDYLDFFDKHRNVVPILSIEGGEETTDERRGKGVYRSLQEKIAKMKAKKIAFGASMTVTHENLTEVTGNDYIQKMKEDGCKALIYVEFVATHESLKPLLLTDADRGAMSDRLDRVRKEEKSMVILSFPGDEKHSGGCLAAGRGFFHIAASGGAEPCPFSPFSDVNVKEMPLREVLKSPLFERLKASELLAGEHDGACVLFGKDEEVKRLVL